MSRAEALGEAWHCGPREGSALGPIIHRRVPHTAEAGIDGIAMGRHWVPHAIALTTFNVSDAAHRCAGKQEGTPTGKRDGRAARVGR